MPIQFRCSACRKKLSISQRKAGARVTCPACGVEVRVPELAEVADDATGPAARAVVEADEEEGFRLRRRGIEDEGLDMTPMVDVTFLLLIFFMITASFSLQKSLQTEAPQEDTEGFAQHPQIEDLADQSVIVEIDAQNAIFVDDEPVGGLGELQEVLMRKMTTERKREMIIEAHYQARHGTVVGVTDTGIEVGMQRIRRVSRTQN